MAVSSPKYGITRGTRGWQKKVHGVPVWVASLKAAPSGTDADRVWERRLGLPDDDPRKIRLDQKPRPAVERDDLITIEELVDHFLARKQQQVKNGRLQRETFEEYLEALGDFTAHVGKQTRFCDLRASHFSGWADSLGARFGLHRLKKFIILVRMMFRWAGPPRAGIGLVPTLPTYGDGFTLPSRAEFRREKNLAKEKHGLKLYTPEQIREQFTGKMIAIKRKRRIHGQIVKDVQQRHRKPSKALRAMMLLALNGGFGNRDCAFLPTTVVEAALTKGEGWMDYARGKTGVERLFWLWPETRAALEAWSKARRVIEPKKGSIEMWGEKREYKELFFLTDQGNPWVQQKKDQIGMRYAAMLRTLGQKSRGFRSLRRTCRTILAETGQELAIDLIMGHADDSADMAKVYTVEVSREIVRKVCEHGRQRLLFGDSQGVLFTS